ncbi:uncharacterized protein LOC121410172 isoform X2 [Lytechinus variegatus]|uniref:uncharacterized protein LOC121410172 isoform X2 n=1 Tax=Lytechinus variegatus TaxID=7654 RepID=UPI001BB29947|nr:uncharacterized protein LOC121410172 isoform X2 [Lytechinus variegatus]
MDLSVILLTVLSLGMGSYALKITAQDFRVGAFSLKVFGQTKITDLSIVATIARVIMRYDIILLQGIIDSEGTAIDDLLKLVNSVESDDPYSMIISEGLGSSDTMEHYAYLYRSSRANLVRSYKDTGDRFQREPYIAIFESRYTAVSPFAIVGIKTTLEEINLLADVDSELEVKNVIFAGDFNANCGYVSNNRWKEVELRENPRYKWLIEDDVDTTPSDTDCAYRFVIAGAGMESSILPCSASIFRFDVEYNLTQEQVEIVCDHYPIEVSILPSQFKYSDPSLNIAAFNIQIFGVTKSGKDNVMDILAKILNRYDLILIQEIRDSRANEPAVRELQDLVNRNNEDPFQYVISERLGRSSSKEQYAYFYRPSKLELVTSYVFEETQGDVFQREPYIAYFKSPTTYVKEFIIGGIHTKPDEAVAEIDNLVDVYSAIQEKYEVENVIFAGDFNADCSYVAKKRWSDIRLKSDSRFCWLINNDVDTTVKGTDCAYDRFVISGKEMKEGIVPYSAKVFRFDLMYELNQSEAELVSDHYPIELQLRALTDDKEYRKAEILRKLYELLELC